MGWFKRKKMSVLVSPVADAELAGGKANVKRAGGAAVQATNHLITLIGNNNFTVIIAAGMGAQAKTEVNHHGH